jgi:hypothetical protein
MKPTLILLLFVLGHVFAFGKQSYHVKGKFVCGDLPLANAKLTLYDEDKGTCGLGEGTRTCAGSADEIMDTALTGRDGSFILEGTASDPLPGDDIDPFLKLVHSCNKRVIKVRPWNPLIHVGEYRTYSTPTASA